LNILSGDLNETAPAKASASGGIFVTTAGNTIAERLPTVDTVVTSQTTTSATYVDLTTVGPQVVVTLSSRALIGTYVRASHATTGQSVYMGYAISGATTLAADDTRAFSYLSATGTQTHRASMILLHTGLTAGSNTFTAKYRVDSGTGTFADRRLFVIPF